MKKISLVMGIALIAAMLLFSFNASALDVGYSDPSNDVENEGMEQEYLPNIDITEVMVTVSGDTVTVELTVAGTIIYETEGKPFYQYRIMFDLDGDLEQDAKIELDTWANTYTFDVDDGVDETISDRLSGNGTPKLTVTLPAAWFGDLSDYDIEAEATTGDLMDYADDEVNDDFEGGTPIDGDDDVSDDDDASDDDTTDDDAADDDTTDDDASDDDATDDDATDDDDEDDSPGFGLLLVLVSMLGVLVPLRYFMNKKR
ncbi:MAG: hypothetical protein ACMUHB_06715 [Thermoplasmatota archaeon]